MKKKITVKKVLSLSVVIFFIYLIASTAIYIKDKSEPNAVLLALGSISVYSIIICCLVLFIRLLKRILSPNRRLPIPEDDEITFTTSTKLGKSSHQKILKATTKKALKAEAKIEKKHNPVRSVSYIPPTEDELKAKERDQYLKRNFNSKLKTLWNGSVNIEFSYSDANDDISYRHVELNQVAINRNGELYLSGICDSCDENRTFKIERIISNIEHNNVDYSTKQFLTRVLKISHNSDKTNEKSSSKVETFDIHFTGFRKADEERLIKLAQAKDLTVRKSVTQNLQVLCVGYNASQNKIEKAKNNNIPVMKEDEFLHFLETGEIS